MEKALIKVGSLKASTFWVSKKAKEEISNISQDISVYPFRLPLISLLDWVSDLTAFWFVYSTHAFGFSLIEHVLCL